MTDWERVVEELQETGYSGFEFESGETAVPGLSGEWVAGDIVREDRLRRENQSLWVRILDSLPGSGVPSRLTQRLHLKVSATSQKA